MNKKVVLRYAVVLVAFSFLLFVLIYFKGGLTGFVVYEGPGEGQTTLMLQEANTENLGDSYVGSGGDADKNFGTASTLKTGSVARTYIKFNISAIPSNQNIDNATLCSYILNTKKTQLIDINHVYVNFDESTITWNNQPCGSAFDNSANCNLTAESSIQMDPSFEYVWRCWEVTGVVGKDYGLGNENISLVLYTSDSDINSFNSKEAGDSNLRPYLNITYSQADTTPPSLQIDFPVEGATYNYNENINLNYTVSDENLQTCWYNLDYGENITITACQNAFFNTTEGAHTINLYANDSLGNENESSSTFTINLNSPPTTTIVSPQENQIFTSLTDIPLNYIAEDIDNNLDSCWYNLDYGENITIDNCLNTTFNVPFDSTYILNLYVNDTNGEEISQQVIFIVDSTGISLSITEPTGTKSSRNNIPLEFTASGTGLTCWYNVYRGDNIEVSNTTINCSASTSFNVTVDADFTLNLYANNTFGSSNSSSSEFTVSTATGGGGTPSGSGGAGGGTFIMPPRKPTLELSSVGNIVIKPGESQTLEITAKNLGTFFLNKCKIESSGEISDWISSEGTKNLDVGEESDFVFNLKIPEDTEAGDYSGEISLICNENKNSQDLIISVIKKQVEIKITNVEVTQDSIVFSYILRELNNKELSTEIIYWLEDTKGNMIAENSEEISLSPGEEQGKQTTLELPANTIGEFILNIKSSSGVPDIAQESLILSGGGLTGIVIRNLGKGAPVIIIIFIAGVLVFFIARRIIKNIKATKAQKESRKGIIKIKAK